MRRIEIMGCKYIISLVLLTFSIIQAKDNCKKRIIQLIEFNKVQKAMNIADTCKINGTDMFGEPTQTSSKQLSLAVYRFKAPLANCTNDYKNDLKEFQTSQYADLGYSKKDIEKEINYHIKNSRFVKNCSKKGSKYSENRKHLEKKIGKLKLAQDNHRETFKNILKSKFKASKKKPKSQKVTSTNKKEKELLSKINRNKCRRLSRFYIRQRLSDKRYEITDVHVAGMYTVFKEGHILETNQTKYESTGYTSYIDVKVSGNQTVTLENGFQKKVPVFRENQHCKKLYDQFAKLGK